MKKTISQKQKTIIGISVVLVVVASGLSNLLESQPKSGAAFGTRPSTGSWQPNNPNQWQTSDSGIDTWQANQQNMPSFADGTAGFGEGATTDTASSTADMGSSAITDGYWERQAIQDGLARDRSNQILDQTTVRNQATGETFQTESGSDTYYQSPSADAAMGGSGIVGIEAGGVAPSDGTQLSVVTGSNSGSSSSDSGSSSAGGE